MKKTIVLALIAYIGTACTPQSTSIASQMAPTLEATATDVIETSTPTPLSPTHEIPIATPAPSVRISPADGMTQLYVPAGSLHMGGLDVFSENDEKPVHVVQLDAFWIDQVEVTNGMYSLCVQAGICDRPMKVNSDNRQKYFGNAEFRDYPVVYVTWLDAKTYCEWAGRRLPTEAEWERAARGDDTRTYPWGGEPPNALLANADNDLGDTSRVGSYAAGVSPFGALDMAGNVWEWVADYYDQAYYANSPDPNPTGPADEPRKYERVIRGGSYQDGVLDLRLSNRGYELGPDPAAAPGTAAYVGHSSVRIGFRCAADN